MLRLQSALPTMISVAINPKSMDMEKKLSYGEYQLTFHVLNIIAKILDFHTCLLSNDNVNFMTVCS